MPPYVVQLVMNYLLSDSICIAYIQRQVLRVRFLLQEFRLRFVGFGSEEDEWVNLKNAIRVRSLPLEHSECGKVKVGDLVLCFQVILPC